MFRSRWQRQHSIQLYLEEAPRDALRPGERVSRDAALLRPTKDGARFDFQVLSGLIRGEPFGFHCRAPFPGCLPLHPNF